MITQDLGIATAYGYAKSKGYTGTEAEFAELMASYAEVGQTAVDAAESALNSKTAAQTAATTATNKASEATTAATTATTKAGEASTSASTATSAKDTAVSASQAATSKASEATTAAATATSAKTDAVAANTAAQSAKTAAQTAQTGAETAAASVSASAEQIATNAADIDQLMSELTAVTGNGVIPLGGEHEYINLSASTVTITNGVPQSSGTSELYSYFWTACSPGDVFVINGIGGGGAQLWGFVSSTGLVLSKSGANASAANLEVVAPDDAAFIITHTKDDSRSYIGALLVNKVSTLKDNLSRLEFGKKYTVTERVLNRSTYVYYVDIPKGYTCLLKNLSDTITVNVSDGDQIVNISTGVRSGEEVVFVTPFDVKQIRTYVNGINCSYEITVYSTVNQDIKTLLSMAEAEGIVCAETSEIKRGTWNGDNVEAAENLRLYWTKRTAVKAGDTFWYKGSLYVSLSVWDGNGNRSYTSGWVKDELITILDADGYAQVIYANGATYESSTNILPSDYDGITCIKHKPAEKENAQYFKAEIDDTVSKLLTACEEKSIVFPIITDSHNYYNGRDNWSATKTNLGELGKKYKLDFVAHLGDIIEGNADKTTSESYLMEVVADLLEINPNVVTLTGNHEDNHPYYNSNGTGLISDAERYAILGRYNDTTVQRVGTNQYFYFDFVDKNMPVRVICLDGFMGDGYNGMTASAWGYTDAEVAWVRDVALDTTNQVVFLSHTQLSSVYSKNYDNGYTVHNSEQMLGVINTFITNGGVVIGFFCGHTHMDFIGVNSIGIHEVQTGSQSMDQNPTAGNYTYSNGEYTPTAQSRTKGTVSEELWDIVVISPIARKVTLIRFGAGSDRSFTY